MEQAMDITKFCTTNDPRSYMHKPMRHDGYLYATNGHIAVRIADDPAIEAEPIPQPADTGAKLTLGQINQRLSPIALSAAGLAQLGIQPAGKERAAVLYLESDIARICSVLIRHLTTVARGEIKEAA